MNSFIKNWYTTNHEVLLKGRYIYLDSITALLESYAQTFEVDIIGYSVNKNPIHKILIGSGPKRIMMWSQMHGNESTTTKAVFDLLKLISVDPEFSNEILSKSTLCIIPMLNPDGAKAYTRVNANEIDLNRDAQNLSQPESKVLRQVYNEFKPDFCFNLHDQRTIFSVGNTNKPATVSFLSPAEDENRTVTPTRKKSMEVIAAINTMLQEEIPGQVGRYDDSFNINCVGDTFQSLDSPTLLFESGHYNNDYEREKTRELIFYSLVKAITYIVEKDVSGDNYETYFDIPENDKLFLDIIYRDFPLIEDGKEKKTDIGILYKETLVNNKIKFVPEVYSVGDLKQLCGHKELTNTDTKFSPTDIEGFILHYLAIV